MFIANLSNIKDVLYPILSLRIYDLKQNLQETHVNNYMIGLVGKVIFVWLLDSGCISKYFL